MAIAVRNANIQGANTAAYIGENIQVTPNAKESLVLGSNVTLDKEGVFVFNMKAHPFLPQKEHTFLVNAEHGMIVGTGTSANKLVQLTVAGALRVGNESCSPEKQGAIFKKEGCICGCAENGQGQALLADPSCVATCGGGGSPLLPQNGQCGTAVNSCEKGILQDTTDSSTHYRWNCNGQNGGSSVACMKEIPAQPVNGQCGTAVNQCLKGRFQDTTDSSTHSLWKCLGQN